MPNSGRLKLAHTTPVQVFPKVLKHWNSKNGWKRSYNQEKLHECTVLIFKVNHAGTQSQAAGVRFCSRHGSGNCRSRAGKKITGPQCRCLINVIYSSNYSEGSWSVSSPGLALSDSWSWWRSPFCLHVLPLQPGCYEAANPITQGSLEKSRVLKSVWYFCC